MNKTYGFGLYGMYGPVTDPGEKEFTEKVKALGVDVLGSPYRDYEVNTVVEQIKQLPTDVKIILWGSSLGANNCPVIASLINYRTIDGMWGFQASEYGAKVPITSNVLFAHEVYNPIYPETFGLGHYQWEKRPGNHTTNLYLTPRRDIHPGETEAAQEMFLGEIKRVIEN